MDRTDTLVFTYDVFWEKSETEWSSRWDTYLLADAPNDKVSRDEKKEMRLKWAIVGVFFYFIIDRIINHYVVTIIYHKSMNFKTNYITLFYFIFLLGSRSTGSV